MAGDRAQVAGGYSSRVSNSSRVKDVRSPGVTRELPGRIAKSQQPAGDGCGRLYPCLRRLSERLPLAYRGW